MDNNREIEINMDKEEEPKYSILEMKETVYNPFKDSDDRVTYELTKILADIPDEKILEGLENMWKDHPRMNTPRKTILEELENLLKDQPQK